MSVKYKHIIQFPKWTKSIQINESLEEYEEIKRTLNEIQKNFNSDFTSVLGPSGSITSSNMPDLTTITLDWLEACLDLYESGKYQTYIFMEAKKTLTSNFKHLDQIFKKSNSALTSSSRTHLPSKFKTLIQSEPIKIKAIDDTLSSLGLL